eukprot:3288010-Prymnesium_polylepis.1
MPSRRRAGPARRRCCPRRRRGAGRPRWGRSPASFTGLHAPRANNRSPNELLCTHSMTQVWESSGGLTLPTNVGLPISISRRNPFVGFA